VEINQANASKLPEDLLEQLEEIKKVKSALLELQSSLSNEVTRRNELESIITNVNSEMEHVRQVLLECVQNVQLNRNDINVGFKFNY
jgi:hypothetical protein